MNINDFGKYDIDKLMHNMATSENISELTDHINFIFTAFNIPSESCELDERINTLLKAFPNGAYTQKVITDLDITTEKLRQWNIITAEHEIFTKLRWIKERSLTKEPLADVAWREVIKNLSLADVQQLKQTSKSINRVIKEIPGGVAHLAAYSDERDIEKFFNVKIRPLLEEEVKYIEGREKEDLEDLQTQIHTFFTHATAGAQVSFFKQINTIEELNIIINFLPEGLNKLFIEDGKNSQQIVTPEIILQIAHRLHNLTHLGFHDPNIIFNASYIAGLENLKNLDLSGNVRLTGEELQELVALKNLQDLNLSGCRNLTSIPFIVELVNLQKLDLSRNDRLTGEELQVLKALKKLEVLDLSFCHELTNLQFLTGMELLRYLNLSHCFKLTDVELQNIAPLKMIEHLDLSSCHKLTNLRFLTKFAQLRYLNLSKCDNLTDAELLNISQLHNLRNLNLSFCNISQLGILTELQQLWDLDLSHCDKLPNQELQNIALLNNLRRLHLSSCNQLTHLGFLKDLKQLRDLDLSHFRAIEEEELQNIAPLKKLECLDLSFIDLLTDLHFLSGFEHLRILKLESCPYLADETLQNIMMLKTIEDLDLSDCKYITNINFISGLQHLRNLNLKGCDNLKKEIFTTIRDNLENLPNLSSVKLLYYNHFDGKINQDLRKDASMKVIEWV